MPGMATNKFPDGNFSQPRLAIFAFRFAQTKIKLRLSIPGRKQTNLLTLLHKQKMARLQ